MSAPVVVGPRAMHFGERPDGTFVALIAVDELPESIDIRGVPRFLSREDMDGMTDFGILSARRQETYIVDGVQYDDENLGKFLIYITFPSLRSLTFFQVSPMLMVFLLLLATAKETRRLAFVLSARSTALTGSATVNATTLSKVSSL